MASRLGNCLTCSRCMPYPIPFVHISWQPHHTSHKHPNHFVVVFVWLQLFQHKNSISPFAPFSPPYTHTLIPLLFQLYILRHLCAELYHSCFLLVRYKLKHIQALIFMPKNIRRHYTFLCILDANKNEMIIRKLIHWSWDWTFFE